MEPSENNSQPDGTNNLASSCFPKDDDIEPVASGSLLKVNGDNHITGLPFKQPDEDSCSSSNSSSSHNLVIDQPEEVTYNNNAGNESESETLKKACPKDLSVNPLKRKFQAQEDESPEHKQINLTNSNTLFTKSPQKLLNNSPSEFFKNGKADINENRSTLTLSEAYEKKFKAMSGSRGDGVDHFQEYAKYLRLKPAVKYKCFKCYNITFDTLAQLRNHQKVCFFKENHRHSSQDGNSIDAFLSSNSNPSSIENLSALASTEQMQARLQRQFLDTKTTTKAKKKVFLCAACGTYYENWNLFLHMREVHKRHICLYCVGMFPTAEKLTLHLEMKHDLEQNHFESHEKLLRSSRDTCYLMCCICENIFTEHDDFQDHNCSALIPACKHCGQRGRHISSCISIQPERVKEKVKRRNKNNKESSAREKRLEPGVQPAAERTRLVGDSSCDKPKMRTENPSHWNFKVNGCVPEANVRHSEQQAKPSEINMIDKRSPARKDIACKLNNSQGDMNTRHAEDEQGRNLSRNSSQLEDIAQPLMPTILKSILSDENKGRRSPQINSLFPALRESKAFKGLDDEEGRFISPIKELSSENNNNPLSNITESESDPIPHGDNVPSMKTNTIESLKEEDQTEKPLFVPKFKIKIPKEYQTPIDSEHSSTESDEEEMENSANGGEISEEETKEEFQDINEKVTADSPEKMELDPEPVQEEQKSLESNISKEQDEPEQKTPEDVDNRGDSDNNMDIEAPIEVHEAPKESPPDGIEVAGDDILIVELQLDRPLDKIPMVEFLRICMRSTYTICLYCNHARRIAVNGHSLALHMLAQHRFSATVDSITAEELQPPTIVLKLKAFLPDLEEIFFNMETYCSTEKDVFYPYEKIFECFLCRFETKVHKELYLHNRKMHLKTAILCFMCRANFFSYSEILCHMCPGVPNKCVIFDIKFRCCLCDIDEIPSAFRLMVHIRKKHFACDVCLEDCQDQSKLSSHVWKHKLHHLCYRCGIAYRNKPDITKHLFWKHGTESILCKRCLQKRWPHVYHFCIPPPSFNCDSCSLTFSRATFLKVHKRLHTGYAPYPCTEDNCEEKFISRKLLLKHVALHNAAPEVKPIENVKEEEGKKDEDVKPKNDVEDDVKKDNESGKKKKKRVKKESKNSIDDLMNLPAPNLSESDSSDDSESMRAKDNLSPHVPNVMLSPPSDVGEDDKEMNAAPIMDIWENFKSFQASRNKNKKKEEDQSDEVPITPILHVSQSDHDYCMMYKPITKDDKLDSSADIKETLEKPHAAKEMPSTKKKQKSPRKAHKSGSDSSSSGSSSSSSSSCSCGSNCSCSSSSGSSSDSSSSSEDSISSTSEGRRRIAAKRAAKEEKRNRNKSESSKANTSEVVDVVGTDSKPVNINSTILETDLETDESDTDEDFYDDHPQKLASQMLAEKRKQLMMQTCLSPSHNFDIVENSRPSTPSLPEEMMKEKKVKIKKKKRDKKASKVGVIPTLKLTIPSLSGPVNTSVISAVKMQEPLLPPADVAPQVERLAPAIPELLPSPLVAPQTPPIPQQIPQPSQVLQIPQSRTSTPIPAPVAPRNRLSTGSSSDADAPLKRSKRARRPNRFYGYSSDDDSVATHVTGPAAFKPTPPPNLTWRKEDLPAPSKSIATKSSKVSSNSLKKNTPTNTPPLPPIPPIIIRPTGITQSRASATEQKPPIVEPMRVPPVPVHHIQPPQYYSSSRESMESESSDEDKLHIPITTKYGAHRQQVNPLPSLPVQAAPPQQPPPPPKQRIPPALLPNPDLARLQYFQRNNIRWPIRPPAGARPAREGESVYCYCRCPYDEVSEMIACDGDDCMIEWFHFECVGILVPPKGKWFCPECKPNYRHEMENYEDT